MHNKKEKRRIYKAPEKTGQARHDAASTSNGLHDASADVFVTCGRSYGQHFILIRVVYLEKILVLNTDTSIYSAL